MLSNHVPLRVLGRLFTASSFVKLYAEGTKHSSSKTSQRLIQDGVLLKAKPIVRRNLALSGRGFLHASAPACLII